MTGVVPLLPPRAHAPDGAPRRVGVEIEFTGLDGREVAALARRLFGGAVVEDDPYRCRVRGTGLGELTVELDMSGAHPDKGRDPASGLGERVEGPASLGERVEGKLRQALDALGSLLLPFEVAFPPVPIPRLAEIDRLIAALRGGGAKGTKDSILYAFGLHLNPEAAAFDAGYLVDHLKAFALLAPWLRAEIQVDLARRLSPFIEPWPASYVRKLVDPAYRPPLPRLIDDYLAANPTRDRELDMLPLLARIDPERVAAGAKRRKVKPRPAFHYRLPDSRIDQPGWGVVADWNRWVAVERLAAEPAGLADLGRRYLDRFADDADDRWVEEVRRWLGG